MDEISRSIAERIKSGKYFTDARDWYAQKYLYPFNERAILGIVAIFFAICIVVSATNLYLLFPISKEEPLILANDDVLNDKSILKEVMEKDTDIPQIAVSRYLVKYYVTLRESYFPSEFVQDKYQNVLNKVAALSSKPVFREYRAIYDIQNTNSPLVKYNNNAYRVVQIDSVSMPDGGKHPDSAVVYFTTKTSYLNQQNSNISEKWRAEIYFTLPDLEDTFKSKDKNMLSFIVNDYQITKLN